MHVEQLVLAFDGASENRSELQALLASVFEVPTS